MWQDLRYGLRSIRNQPAFTALAVLTLALGIGAATTIFSVIQNVLLDPFPYKDANRVVAIRIHDSTNPQPFGRRRCRRRSSSNSPYVQRMSGSGRCPTVLGWLILLGRRCSRLQRHMHDPSDAREMLRRSRSGTED